MTENQDILATQATVIRNLRRIANERQISIYQLFELSDVSVEEFEDWLAGYVTSPDSPVPRIAYGLGLTSEDLCASETL